MFKQVNWLKLHVNKSWVICVLSQIKPIADLFSNCLEIWITLLIFKRRESDRYYLKIELMIWHNLLSLDRIDMKYVSTTATPLTYWGRDEMNNIS